MTTSIVKNELISKFIFPFEMFHTMEYKTDLTCFYQIGDKLNCNVLRRACGVWVGFLASTKLGGKVLTLTDLEIVLN